MLNRKAVKNRIEALVKEYESEGLGTDLGDAMTEVLKAIYFHSKRQLTYQEFLSCDGIPVWIESTEKWLNVSYECEKEAYWIIPSIWNNRVCDRSKLPFLWDEKTYGKYWFAYEKVL